MKTLKNTISIEDVTAYGDRLIVDYLFNDEPTIIQLSLSGLKLYALNRELNTYVNDDCVNGDHEQTDGSLDINIYMEENLNSVCQAYLLEYPLETVGVKIDALIVALSGPLTLTA